MRGHLTYRQKQNWKNQMEIHNLWDHQWQKRQHKLKLLLLLRKIYKKSINWTILMTEKMKTLLIRFRSQLNLLKMMIKVVFQNKKNLYPTMKFNNHKPISTFKRNLYQIKLILKHMIMDKNWYLMHQQKKINKNIQNLYLMKLNSNKNIPPFKNKIKLMLKHMIVDKNCYLMHQEKKTIHNTKYHQWKKQLSSQKVVS